MKTLVHRVLLIFIAIFYMMAIAGCGGGQKPKPVITFTASPTLIMTGGTSTLQWSVTGATQVTSADFTVSGNSGQATVSPVATMTYTLTATGPGGQATAIVTVVVVETGKVAFVSARSGSDQLYIMNGDGTNVQLISAAGADVSDPALSPDGTRIAYVSIESGDAEIYIVDTDGTGSAQRVTNNPANDTQPAWSRNNDMLVWTREANETYEYDTIIMKPIEEGTEQELVADGRNPCWDPNADRLAFASRRDGPESIYYIGLTDDAPTKILALANENQAIDHLSWSKNGKLAFGRYDSSQVTVKGAILTVNAAANSTPTSIISNNADNSGPSWSPSGNQLVFYTNRDGNYEIYTANADGSNQIRLTNDPADDGLPVWSQSLRMKKIRVNKNKLGLEKSRREAVVFLDAHNIQFLGRTAGLTKI